mgnify:CR=1 FL=1|jgi:peptidoglycan/xylan/chitin deacetylase (PgdA/CDA1 family)
MTTQTTGRLTGKLVERSFPYVWMYHSIDFHIHDPYLITVDPHRFERQLIWLRRNGLRGVSMRELLQARKLGAGRNLVGLTFDDGYADFLRNALPILKKHGCTATVFVIAGLLGGFNEWDLEGPRKKLLTSHEVQQLVSQGIEIGSHSLSHQRLSGKSTKQLLAEINDSKTILQDLTGQNIVGFCYPYGALDEQAVNAVREAGYDYGCAIWRSPLSGRHALPRTYVGDRDNALRLFAKRIRYAVRLR